MHLKSLLHARSLLLFTLSLISLASAGLIPPAAALLHASNLQPQVHAHLQSYHGQNPPSLPLHSAHNPPRKAPHCPPSSCLTAFLSHKASARNLCSAFTVNHALPKRLDWIGPCVDESGGSIIETLTGACAYLESGEDDLDYGADAKHDL